MAGLKSLFRRKSKKDLGPDRSSTPTPGRSPSSAAMRAQTPTPSSVPPVPQSANTTPIQNRTRMSQGGFSAQQAPSNVVAGSAASRYAQMPAGATPERSTYPIQGNGGQMNTQAQDTGANSSGRASSAQQNVARRSIPPGTALSSQDASAARQRSASQSSAYSDRYADGGNAQRYGQQEDIPPVPSAPLDAYKRSTIGAMPDGISAQSSHNRVVSASSAISTPRTPIADQFAAPSWYTQRGSPPIPEFSQVHPRNTSKPATNFSNGNISEPYQNNTTMATSPTSNLRGNVNTGAVTDRSAALGRAVDSTGREGYAAPKQQQQQQQQVAPVDTYNRSAASGRAVNSSSRDGFSAAQQQQQQVVSADNFNRSAGLGRAVESSGRDGYPAAQQQQQQQVASADNFSRSAGLGRTVDLSGREGYPAAKQQQQQVVPAQATFDDSSLSNGDFAASSRTRRQSIPRKSLEKPLPVPSEMPYSAAPAGRSDMRNGQAMPVRERAPVTTAVDTNQQTSGTQRPVTPSSPVRSGKYAKSPVQTFSKGEIRTGEQQIYNRSYLVEGAASPPSLQGVVDLNNTVDTTTDVHYAPAVIHETVLSHVHHIRQEEFTREIHSYDVHHRILPVVDVQVMPPKHIVRTDASVEGQWVEVPEELVPGRYHQNWVIAETVSKLPSQVARDAATPIRFTARTFPGTEGDYREYVNENGVPTTETTWVHPPTISYEAQRRGITLPLDMP